MIYGIGIDLVKISRLRSAHKKWGGSFFKRIFTEKEIAYCFERKEPYPSLAVRFAAKEAFIKAIGSEAMILFSDIEVVNDKNGRPSIKIQGKLKEFFMKKSIKRCHLSLSHERDYGIASIVLEK